MNRRDFIKTTAMVGAGVALYGAFGAERAHAFYQSSGLGLKLFQQTLRGRDVASLATEIGVAASDGAAPVTRVTHYTMGIQQFPDMLYPTLGPTTLWGFKPANYLVDGPSTPRHLGGIIVAQKGKPIQVTFRNQLTSDGTPTGTPLVHPIPIDITVPGDWSGAGGGAKNRIAVHMHGGHVPWLSDGGPFDWWRADGSHGLVWINNRVFNPAAAINEAEYYYPMDQSARLMWYHDHAFGMDRNTAYAGLASGLIIRDNFELNLGLPRIEGELLNQGVRSFEIPLIFQDKIFVGSDILTVDPTWPGPTSPGSLWYAHVYDTARYGKLGPNPLGPPPTPSTVPEYFGDTMLVNGTVYPEVAVEPRRYRLRILNACNSRFMNLQLYVDDKSLNGITLNNAGNPINTPALNAAALNPTGHPTGNFLVIGTEGGLLPKPAFAPTGVPFAGPSIGSLFMAPAERADVLFDFSAHAGQSLILYSDAPAPFPGGDPRNDYFPGLNNKNPVNAFTPAGQGPNTRVLMRFNVGTSVTLPADAPLNINTNTDFTKLILGGEVYNDPLLATVGTATIPPGYGTPRPLTLNETFDGYGRLIQKLGTNVRQPDGTFGQGYLECGTTGGERPAAGSTEVWEIANLTADTHPIHFHLVNVQIISRQAFAVSSYKGVPNFQGPPIPPASYEAGWKETVRMNPGEVTTVIMKFNLPTIVDAFGHPVDFSAVDNGLTPGAQFYGTGGVGSPPPSPRTGGNEYVWHCHILEHEEHDMMRPLVVT
jgi:spore coat protein A